MYLAARSLAGGGGVDSRLAMRSNTCPSDPRTTSYSAPSSSHNEREPSPPSRSSAGEQDDPRQGQMAPHAIRQVMPLASKQ